MRTHLPTCRGPAPSNTAAKIMCEWCGKMVDSETFTSHTESCVWNGPTVECTKGCGKSFPTQDPGFIEHVAGCSGKHGVRRMCNLCGFMVDVSVYDDHVLKCVDTPVSLTRCSKCNKDIVSAIYSGHIINCGVKTSGLSTRQCPKCYVWLFDNVYLDHFVGCRPDAVMCLKCEKWVADPTDQTHVAVCRQKLSHADLNTWCNGCSTWVENSVYKSHDAKCAQSRKCTSCMEWIPRDTYIDHFTVCSYRIECPYCSHKLKSDDFDGHLDACMVKFDQITCARCKKTFSQGEYDVHCVECKPEVCACGEVDPSVFHKSKCIGSSRPSLSKCQYCTYIARTSDHMTVHVYHRHANKVDRKTIVEQYLKVLDTSTHEDLDMGEDIEVSPSSPPSRAPGVIDDWPDSDEGESMYRTPPPSPIRVSCR